MPSTEHFALLCRPGLTDADRDDYRHALDCLERCGLVSLPDLSAAVGLGVDRVASLIAWAMEDSLAVESGGRYVTIRS